MGLLDLINGGDGAPGSGLLEFLRANAMNQQPAPGGLPSDMANYGQPAPFSMAPPQAMQPPPVQPQANPQPSPLDTAQWPAGPIGAPSSANAAMPQAKPAPFSMAAQPAPQAPQSAPAATPASDGPGIGDRLAMGARGFVGNLGNGGILGGLYGGLGSLVTGKESDPVTQERQLQTNALTANATALQGSRTDPAAIQAAVASARVGNMEPMKVLFNQAYGPVQSIGEGHIIQNGKVVQAYEPADKTPQSVSEYKYYVENLPKGQQPMDYATFSTAKARAGATNINNNVDMNSGVTYDKQLSEGLGKAHTALATGVEDAHTRARDIAAMQGAIDAIQKNGGTTGGFGQQQILDLKKTVNAGATSLGIDQPFSEADLADKEFLTKFNRSMAGAQAKGAVGARVTNFEMTNYLKANPGLDMSVTGNQRLLGIQAQIEQRNIAVGNAIRDATAQAISQGQKINPVQVQKIIADYDEQHHIKDVVTGQDLTQSYALPEFQNTATNASMAGAHSENLKAMEKTIGGTIYVQRNGQWYPKQ